MISERLWEDEPKYKVEHKLLDWYVHLDEFICDTADIGTLQM